VNRVRNGESIPYRPVLPETTELGKPVIESIVPFFSQNHEALNAAGYQQALLPVKRTVFCSIDVLVVSEYVLYCCQMCLKCRDQTHPYLETEILVSVLVSVSILRPNVCAWSQGQNFGPDLELWAEIYGLGRF